MNSYSSVTKTLHPDMIPVSSSSCLLLKEVELCGWAAITEAILRECATTTLVGVAEPRERSRLIAEYTTSFSELVSGHIRNCVQISTAAIGTDQVQVLEILNTLGYQNSRSTAGLEVGIEEQQLSCYQRAVEQCEMAKELRLLRDEVAERCHTEEALRAQLTLVHSLASSACQCCSEDCDVVDHVDMLCSLAMEQRLLLGELEGSPVPSKAPIPPSHLLASAPQESSVTTSLFHVKHRVQQLRNPFRSHLQYAIGVHKPVHTEALNLGSSVPRLKRSTTEFLPTPQESTHSAVADEAVPTSTSCFLHTQQTPLRECEKVDNGVERRVGEKLATPSWRRHLEKFHHELYGLRHEISAHSTASTTATSP